ncbi:hypothetical protein RDWZM_009699, partial [Blomia tropicalis]
MYGHVWFVCIWLFININCEKLNERRILLPYNSGIPTNFTLEALSTNTACYKWSSSRPDVALVRHLDGTSCSRRAMVTVVSRLPKRQASVITAHDLTDLQMRCDVEIDVIDRIVLTTTTRQIVYGELPEVIKAVAYNQQNDVFNSIGGIQFEWTISPLDIIRYRTWVSSSYAAPDFVEYWEAKGAKSSFVLMEGIKTGSAKIKAKILGDSYKSVEPSEITVHVVANLLLIPSNDVFLVRGAKVGFRAEISKQGPRVPLNLPMAQYYLDVTDPMIAYFDESTNQLEAIEEGHTSLVLRDRNVEDEEGLSQTSTDIHVMRPSYILMSITPGEKYALRNDTIYTITLTLHDDWHHRLHSSDNINMTLEFPEKHFNLLEMNSNGTYYVVQTKLIGTNKLKAKFHGAGSYLLDNPLEHVQEFTIYPPITLNPQQMFLPWIPSVKPTYSVFVDALGATGEYNWDSRNEMIANINYSVGSKSSRAIINTRSEGEVEISCFDVHNSQMFNALMNIYIRPIEAIEILPSIVETNIGGNVILPIAILGFLNGKDDKKIYFDDCEQVPLEIEIVEKNRIRYQSELIMPGLGVNSCRSLSFECMASGNSRIWISYGTMKQIKTSAIIGCYAPLKLVHPTNFAVLSLGSIIDIAFEGGPRPWSMYPEGHFTKAKSSNSSVVAMKEIKDRYRYNKDLHVYRTKCTGYGETEIKLEVSNQPSPTLVRPASTVATVRIICDKPETLIIRPRLKPTCPQQDFVFTLEKNRDIELDVQVLDGSGNPFYNFSTLYFEWAKDGNGVFQEAHSIKEEVNGARGYFSLTRNYQLLTGLTSIRSKIRGKISGFHGSYFGQSFDVRREIELVLTDPLTTAENNIAILKHSIHKKSVSIQRGSGYFNVDFTNKDAVEIEFKTNSKEFTIKPKSIGTGLITINDLCLNFPPMSLAYSVVEAIDLKLNLIDKIELGGEVVGEFYILDNRGMRLHSSLHEFLDFVIVSSNNFLSFSPIIPNDEWTSKFTIKAERLGLSKLIIQSQSELVRSVQSSPIEIQIYSPLKILPSNITLIVGSSFQATVVGGPQTQRNIEFTIGDSSFASVTPNGLITTTRIGKTFLTGRLLNVDNFEYSRAEVAVNVVPLEKIKIWAPVNQLLAGSSMPLYLIGNNAEQWESPFMFGSADPALKIVWSLSNEKIANVEGSFEEDGILDSNFGQISTRFFAKAIGVVIVKVRVEVTQTAANNDEMQIVRNIVLTDSVQINVYSDFSPTFTPSGATGLEELEKSATPPVLLMSPNSELLLHFNNLDRVTYKVLNATQINVFNNTELVLRAGDVSEQALLLIHRDMHRTGVVEFFSYALHVDKIRYLSLRFDRKHRPKMSFASKIDVLPIGSEINLVVQYFDNHGRKFNAVKSNIKFSLSRNDIITVLNDISTIKIRAMKEGSVVMKVIDEVNGLSSYYKLNVGSIIEPKHISPISIQVGDIICLRNRLSHPRMDSNLDDTASFGSFVALNPGKGTIMFNSTSTGLSTYINIVVRPITQLRLDLSSMQVPIGITTTSLATIPIRTGSSIAQTKLCSQSNMEILSTLRSLRANHLLPFTCDVAFVNSPIINSLWDAEVQYITSRNQWACVLVAKKSSYELENVALFDLNVTITAMSNVVASNDIDLIDLNDIGFHQVTIPFFPIFQVSTKQIILTSDSKVVRFTVNSVKTVLENLSIKSSNEDILNVQLLELVENSLKVMITLQNADIFSNDVSNLHLILVSTLTNQTERIGVQIKLYGTLAQLPSQILSTSFYQTTTVITLFLTIFLIMIIGMAIRFFMSSQFKFVHDFNEGKVSTSPTTSPRR